MGLCVTALYKSKLGAGKVVTEEVTGEFRTVSWEAHIFDQGLQGKQVHTGDLILG